MTKGTEKKYRIRIESLEEIRPYKLPRRRYRSLVKVPGKEWVRLQGHMPDEAAAWRWGWSALNRHQNNPTQPLGSYP